jgi:hypothetical protein
VPVTFALGTAVRDWTLEHHLSSWLHQDLEHRLAHFHTPVLTIRHERADPHARW